MTDTPMTPAEWRETLDTLIALRGKGREFDKMHLVATLASRNVSQSFHDLVATGDFELAKKELER